MADLRQHEALVEQVAKARKEASRRPELKRPTGSMLNIINGHAYAYSGLVGVINVQTTLIEMTTNSEAILGEFNFNKNTSDGDDMEYQVLINNIEVQGWRHDYSARGFRNIAKILIPPFSSVKATANNKTGSSSRNILCSFTGEVI